MKVLKFLYKFILSGLAFASIISHLFPNFWLADVFSHFKFQYFFLLLFLLLPVTFLLFEKKGFLLLLIIALIGWNGWFIFPLYIQNSVIAGTIEKTFSILSLNLLASNSNYSEALQLIKEKDADVVVLLELSEQWKKQMEVLREEYPFQEMHSQTDNFGIGILSKSPMNSKLNDFGKDFPPSVISKIKFSGDSLTILATHPVPPVGPEMFNFRNHQLEEITEFSKKQQGNFIVAGDLNTSSFSEYFQKMLERGELKDSRKGFGIVSSWPTDFLPMRTTLDHFLLKGDLSVLERTTEVGIGSDHLPIYIKVGVSN